MLESTLYSGIPEGLVEIARRFNAGFERSRTQVPKGRLEIQGSVFSRPFGTYTIPEPIPALKRRAISNCPYGTPNRAALEFMRYDKRRCTTFCATAAMSWAAIASSIAIITIRRIVHLTAETARTPIRDKITCS